MPSDVRTQWSRQFVAQSIFWTSVCLCLQGAAAATGVALINSIANIGGMIGPYLIGQVACPMSKEQSCLHHLRWHSMFRFAGQLIIENMMVLLTLQQ